MVLKWSEHLGDPAKGMLSWGPILTAFSGLYLYCSRSLPCTVMSVPLTVLGQECLPRILRSLALLAQRGRVMRMCPLPPDSRHVWVREKKRILKYTEPESSSMDYPSGQQMWTIIRGSSSPHYLVRKNLHLWSTINSVMQGTR